MRRVLWVPIAAVVLTACADDVERGPAERRNLAALDTIPTPAGSVVVRTSTNGRTAPDTSEGPIVGWDTTRALRLTRQARAEQVVLRARTDLQRGGWRVVNTDDFYLNARRDRPCLHLLTSAEAPSERLDPPETTATDVAPAGSELAPGDSVAQGLVLKVSDC